MIEVIFGMLVAILWAVLVIGTLVYLVLVYRLCKILAVQYPSVHESLGSPSLLVTTRQNNRALRRWLFDKEYESWGDVHVVRLAARVRNVLLTLYIDLAAMVVVFVLHLAAVEPTSNKRVHNDRPIASRLGSLPLVGGV